MTMAQSKNPTLRLQSYKKDFFANLEVRSHHLETPNSATLSTTNHTPPHLHPCGDVCGETSWMCIDTREQ